MATRLATRTAFARMRASQILADSSRMSLRCMATSSEASVRLLDTFALLLTVY